MAAVSFSRAYFTVQAVVVNGAAVVGSAFALAGSEVCDKYAVEVDYTAGTAGNVLTVSVKFDNFNPLVSPSVALNAGATVISVGNPGGARTLTITIQSTGTAGPNDTVSLTVRGVVQ